MKKIYFFIFLIFVCYANVNAQIRVFSDGSIGMFGATSNGGYCTNTKGWGHQLADNNQGEFRYMRFQITTLNPRISGTHNCVVFYSGENSIHQDIQVKDIYQYSDREGKENILPLFNSLDKVKSLNPVSFSWKNDTESVYKKNSSGTIKQQLGFIAQDIEQVLPDLVILDEEGNKLINYVAIVPVLVDAVKELNGKVEKLEQELADIKSDRSVFKSSNLMTGVASIEDSKSVLYQNTPNPSSGNTRIKYSVPAFKSANICVFNLNGGLLLKKEITASGNGEILIKANELPPGMYIYSLLVDNNLIDTKRMVLTK